MKAIAYTSYGGPEVLGLVEVGKPVPKDNEVLVKVHASTVNRTDCGFLRAKPFVVRFFSGMRRPKNTILGNEVAGVVEATGKAVTKFKTGDHVFGYSGERFGGHAEYILLDAAGPMATLPDNMGFEEVVPSTEAIHYAWADIRAAGVHAGQRVLINGGTGAIGSAAVQLVKHIGAHVTAVCNTPNLELMRTLGADQVINYLNEDFTQCGQEYDFVFDAVGKSSFGACKKIMKPGGIYCSTEFGYMVQNPVLALWTSKFGSRKVIFPIPQSSQKDVEFFRDLLASGKFKPVIDRTYPLSDVAEAFRYVETGQKTGNVVIRVTS